MDITAVVVNHNGAADTVECVGSLRRSRDVSLRILVVDNGSSPPLSLPAEYENVQIVRLEANLGFAGGVNAGIELALKTGANAVLVMNNDAVIAPDALALLSEALKGDVGIAAPRIYYASDPLRIWSDGFLAGRWTLEMRGGQRGLRAREGEEPVRRVDYVAGCVMLIRRSVFEAVGLFDRRFFAYYEDLDFCARARDAGFSIVTVPTAHAWHKVARTTGLHNPRRHYLLAYGSVRFFAKHAGRRWPLVVLSRAASLAKTTIQLTAGGQCAAWIAYLKGLRDGLRDVFS